VSLPAVDDPKALTEGVGHCFQSVVHNYRNVVPADLEFDWEGWHSKHADLDQRLQLGTSGWTSITTTTRPVTIFSGLTP
jgi:hypothetical protein